MLFLAYARTLFESLQRIGTHDYTLSVPKPRPRAMEVAMPNLAVIAAGKHPGRVHWAMNGCFYQQAGICGGMDTPNPRRLQPSSESYIKTRHLRMIPQDTLAFGVTRSTRSVLILP